MELKDLGILEIRHGRRISVRDIVPPPAETKELTRNLDKLVQQTFQRAHQLHLNEISFSRYFLFRALEKNRASNSLVYADASLSLATERAKELSETWGVPITPMTSRDLGKALAAGESIRYVFTTYHRMYQATEAVEGAGFKDEIPVIPIQVTFCPDLIRKLHSFKEGTVVWLLTHPTESDKFGQQFTDGYQQAFSQTKLRFLHKEASKETEIIKAVNSRTKPLVIVNSILWETLSERVKQHPMVLRPCFKFDTASLETARIKAGIFFLPT